MTKTKSQKKRAKQARQNQVNVKRQVLPQTQRRKRLNGGGSRPMGARRIAITGSDLSACARDYAHTLADPIRGPLGCIPTFPALQTRRYRVFVRGTFLTNATGFGYICFDPLSSAANDIACIRNSSATTVVTHCELANGTVGLQQQFSNSDYNGNDFSALGTGNNARVVGAILRVRYTGTILNCGGLYNAMVEPNHDALQNFTQQDFTSYNECSFRVITPGKWHALHYKPVIHQEMDLLDVAQWPVGQTPFAANTYANEKAFYMGMLVNAAAGSQPFEYEAFSVIEASGGGIRGKTPSHTDYQGLSTVLSTAAQPGFDHSAPSIMSSIVNTVKDIVPYVAKAGLGYMMGGPAGAISSVAPGLIEDVTRNVSSSNTNQRKRPTGVLGWLENEAEDFEDWLGID